MVGLHASAVKIHISFSISLPKGAEQSLKLWDKSNLFETTSWTYFALVLVLGLANVCRDRLAPHILVGLHASAVKIHISFSISLPKGAEQSLKLWDKSN